MAVEGHKGNKKQRSVRDIIRDQEEKTRKVIERIRRRFCLQLKGVPFFCFVLFCFVFFYLFSLHSHNLVMKIFQLYLFLSLSLSFSFSFSFFSHESLYELVFNYNLNPKTKIAANTEAKLSTALKMLLE